MPMGEYTNHGTKCSSCRPRIVNKRDNVTSSDDTYNSHEHKELKKRVKVLENVIVQLSTQLHEQEKKIAGIEGIMEGFVLGINARHNKNIVEIPDK